VLRDLKVDIEKKVQTTLDKQQKEFYLREQIRGLRKELGEAPELRDDDAVLEEKLRAAGMTEAGLAEALRELERLRRMHSDAAEYTVIRTWLEWLFVKLSLLYLQHRNDAAMAVARFQHQWFNSAL
jgi:ATP-dependent Lon protease